MRNYRTDTKIFGYMGTGCFFLGLGLIMLGAVFCCTGVGASVGMPLIAMGVGTLFFGTPVGLLIGYLFNKQRQLAEKQIAGVDSSTSADLSKKMSVQKTSVAQSVTDSSAPLAESTYTWSDFRDFFGVLFPCISPSDGKEEREKLHQETCQRIYQS